MCTNTLRKTKKKYQMKANWNNQFSFIFWWNGTKESSVIISFLMNVYCTDGKYERKDENRLHNADIFQIEFWAFSNGFLINFHHPTNILENMKLYSQHLLMKLPNMMRWWNLNFKNLKIFHQKDRLLMTSSKTWIFRPPYPICYKIFIQKNSIVLNCHTASDSPLPWKSETISERSQPVKRRFCYKAVQIVNKF